MLRLKTLNMNEINRLLINICSDDLIRTKEYYMLLFDFAINFESDWFIHLISQKSKLELGIIQRSHDMVPEECYSTSNGSYLTIVVENVEDIYKLALEQKFAILKEPEDMFYGQRRLLLQDPNGVVLDISAPIKDFAF